MDTVGPLPTDGVWRMAGTFNNWNTSDDAYRLIPNDDGTLSLQRLFDAGRYEFKFVRNGAWDQGHAGAVGGDPSRLIQPGTNIPLIVDHPLPLRITLDPRRRRWTCETAPVDHAVPIVQYATPQLAGRPILVDLARSIPRLGHTITKSRVTGPNTITIKPGPEPMQWLITTQWPGGFDLAVTVFDGDWPEPTTIRLQVERSFQLMIDYDASSVIPMELTPDGTHAAVTDPLDGPRHAFNVRDQCFEKIGRLAYPVADGEQFAVFYDPRLERIDVRPGRFVTNTDEHGRLVIREIGVPVLHDPRRRDHLEAIAEDPPIVDLHAFTTADDDVTAITAVLGNSDGPGRRVPLTPEQWRGGTRWTARVMFEPALTRYELQVTGADGSTARNRYDVQLVPFIETPDWAKGATWYQIFPERFANGDSENDPSGIGVYFKPWGSDHRAVPDEEFVAWQERVRHFGDDPDLWDRQVVGRGPQDGPGRDRLYNVIWDRRYGGDLQGVLEHLDHLVSLGVTAIYFNPVFDAPSLHKYDTADYRHIDPHFGPWDPEGDAAIRAKETLDPKTWGFTAADRYFIDVFLPACKERGIHVIVDGVFNHVGREFFAFRDVQANGTDSPYADWFVAEFGDDGSLRSWAAWDGASGWLPDLRETPEGNLVEQVKQHVFDITRRWHDPNGDGDPSDGIDGWRLDVPSMIGDQFWIEWRRVVKSVNPDAYITAEIWYDATPWLSGDMFDAQMHYPFGSAVVDWLAVRPGMTAHQLSDRLDRAFDDDPPATQLIQQNLYNSHDTDRLASQLFNPGREFDAANRPQDNGPNYNGSRPSDRCFELSRVAVAFQAMYLGAPMIYFGEEYGMWGADDPANRKPMTWPDLMPFDSSDERILPDLLAYYQTWFGLRTGEPALRYGRLTHVDTGLPRVFAFTRQLNEDVLLVVLNAGDRPYHVDAAVLLGLPASLEPVHVDNDGDLGSLNSGVWRMIRN